MALSPTEGIAMNISVKDTVAAVQQQQVTVMIWESEKDLVMIDFKKCVKIPNWRNMRAHVVTEMGRYLRKHTDITHFTTTFVMPTGLIKIEDFDYDQYEVANVISRFLEDEFAFLVKNRAY